MYALDCNALELTPHAHARLVERGICLDDIRQVLGNPKRSVYRSEQVGDRQWRYRHEDERGLVVVTQGHVVVTAFHRSPVPA